MEQTNFYILLIIDINGADAVHFTLNNTENSQQKAVFYCIFKKEARYRSELIIAGPSPADRWRMHMIFYPSHNLLILLSSYQCVLLFF